jgi:hypothetical protein
MRYSFRAFRVQLFLYYFITIRFEVSLSSTRNTYELPPSPSNASRSNDSLGSSN